MPLHWSTNDPCVINVIPFPHLAPKPAQSHLQIHFGSARSENAKPVSKWNLFFNHRSNISQENSPRFVYQYDPSAMAITKKEIEPSPSACTVDMECTAFISPLMRFPHPSLIFAVKTRAHWDMEKLYKCHFRQEIKVYGYLLWHGEASCFSLSKNKQAVALSVLMDDVRLQGVMKVCAVFCFKCFVQYVRSHCKWKQDKNAANTAVCERASSVADCQAAAVICGRWRKAYGGLSYMPFSSQRVNLQPHAASVF